MVKKNNTGKKPAKFLFTYMHWIVDNPFKVIFLTLVFVATTSTGISYVKFKKDYKYFFGKSNPQLINYENLQNVYNKNDNILIAVEPTDGDVFNSRVLSAIEEFTHSAWQIPYAIRVDSLTNFQYSRAMGDDLFVNDLIKDAEQKTPEKITAVRQIALNEPILVNRLINPDGSVAGINITLEMPGKAQDAQAAAVNYARELCRRIRTKYKNINTYVTGIVALDNAMSEASSEDIKKLIPLMLLGITLAIAFLLRSLYSTMLILTIIGLSTVSAIGISGWLHIPITPPSAVAPIMIMTLAVTDCVHILESMFQEYGQTHDRRKAIVTSMITNMKPVFLTSLTTAIGFLSMNFSDAPPLVDLGNISAIGVLVAFVYAVWFLPAMVTLLPIKNSYKKIFTSKSFAKLSDFVIQKKIVILLIFIVLSCILASLVTMNQLNDQWVKYFDTNIKFRTDTDFVQAKLTGIYQIEYSIDSGRTNGVTDPDYLKKIEQFEKWWYTQPNVRHVNSFCEVMRRLNKNMHGDNLVYYRIPQSQELASQYLIVYEMSLPYGLDLNNQINIDKSSMRFIVTMNDIGAKELRTATVKGEQWLRLHALDLRLSPGTGPAVMFSYISERNINGMIYGIALGILFITGVMVISLRSLKYGLLSIIPNTLPAICAFGLWGFFVREVNMAVSVVGAITLGIVVDDTIHFLNAFLRAKNNDHMGHEKAIQYAIAKVGNAIVITSIVLSIGFITISFSSFQVNSGMGKLSAIIIGFAIFADMMLLPAILLYGKKTFN